ncbi:MAG: ATP-binding protein [Chloroflexi bacterium]|nr:ATP-binding protein [Chloroflexota bacterium]
MIIRLNPKSLRTRILLTYLILIAVSLALLVWRVGSSLDASRFAETRRDQEYRAILAAGAAEESLARYRDGKIDLAALAQEAATLSREISQPVVLLDSHGRVLIDSESLQETGSDDSGLPEVLIGANGSSGSAIRYDADDGGDALFTVAPVHFQRDLVGVVRLELQMSLVQQASAQLWIRIVAAALLVALLTAAVSLWFAKSLADPIGAITRAASALARGDLSQRVRAAGPDELQQLANGFNVMAERVSRVMVDQRAFVANAAHELRTPLTTIRLRVEALSDGAREDPAIAARFLADITSETERLSRLVDELLDLSRIESGLVTAKRAPTSVAEIAQHVANELEPRATESGVSIQVKATERIPRLALNPDQIRQVFINLIDNGIKFTPAGGTIRITIQMLKQQDDDGHLGQGTWVLTTVADSGVGIPAEDLPYVFDRFYRSDKARARSTGGAGLGLAIVKSIVDHHGGHVWAQSDAGAGTAVVFVLPIV